MLDEMNIRKRILLGHLNSNGDCLYATTVARQIKNDNPNCHLTWAIGSMCRPIIDNNPYVDAIWEIPLLKIEDAANVWRAFEKKATELKKKKEFAEIYFTQFSPCRYFLYDGIIRSSTLRGYPKPITVSVIPVLRLRAQEIENVRRFSVENNFFQKKNIILFEYSANSGQSFVTQKYALHLSKLIVKYNKNTLIVLSSYAPIKTGSPDIIDGSKLTLRENAELTKYCNLLIGCSSGISWISTSDWSKPIPKVQLLKSDPIWYASMIKDHELFGLPTDAIIEMSECKPEKVAECVSTILNDNIKIAKKKYHENLPITFNSFDGILKDMIFKRQFDCAKEMIIRHIELHGTKALARWHVKYVLKKVARSFRHIL